MELRTIAQPNKRQRSVTIILTRKRETEKERDYMCVCVCMCQSIEDACRSARKSDGDRYSAQ